MPVSSSLSVPIYVVPECLRMLSIKKIAKIRAEMSSLLFCISEWP